MNTFRINIGQTLGVCIAALAIAGGASKASAQIPYGNSGTPNFTSYTFTATSTGDVTAYFAGTGASYDEQVEMLVNGIASVQGFGLDNKSSTVGQSFDMGHVTAGDTLTFEINISSLGNQIVSSDPAANAAYDFPAGIIYSLFNGGTPPDHIYSTPYTDGSLGNGIPSGTYVGFEYLSANSSDWNYFDETYVFTDVGLTVNPTPDASSSMALLGIGFAGLSFLRRRIAA